MFKQSDGMPGSRLGKPGLVLVLLLLLILALSGCGVKNSSAQQDKPVLVLADASWDSIKVHNRIMGFIIKNGYGYPAPDYRFGDTLPLLQGLSKGDIDIYSEIWADNIKEAWDAALADGSVKDLGANFPDAPQGWYVPTYMIKGDAERGIKAVAPDLQSVSDLPKYWKLFKDPEVPSKGRFHNSPPGWICSAINETKIKTYGLDSTYNVFSTGSDAALVASMVAAYEKGVPWLGYYWEPTWVMGKMDMTLLEEPAYDEAKWNNEKDRGCAYPAAKVPIGINSELETTAPELVEFLSKYSTTLAQNNAFLAYMNAHDNDVDKAAIYFLKQYPDTWKAWIPVEVAQKVDASLKEVQ
jgi:ABC-type proline/glycine betaine transport systems, periplasmic components